MQDQNDSKHQCFDCGYVGVSEDFHPQPYHNYPCCPNCKSQDFCELDLEQDGFYQQGVDQKVNHAS